MNEYPKQQIKALRFLVEAEPGVKLREELRAVLNYCEAVDATTEQAYLGRTESAAIFPEETGPADATIESIDLEAKEITLGPPPERDIEGDEGDMGEGGDNGESASV